jgi:uncharacterized membrane protein
MGIVIWYALRKVSKFGSNELVVKSQTINETAPKFTFKWRYVLIPLIILLLSVIAVVYFYQSLPTSLAYHFTRDGTGDRWLSRESFIVIILLSQFLLTFTGAMVAFVVAKVGQWSSNAGVVPVKAFSSLITIMSNMVVLPQLILFFTMLDIFRYNAYQVHLFSTSIFAMLVMLVGGLVLAFLFFRAIKKSKVPGGNN